MNVSNQPLARELKDNDAPIEITMAPIGPPVKGVSTINRTNATQTARYLLLANNLTRGDLILDPIVACSFLPIPTIPSP